MIDINFIPHPLQGAPYGTALDLAILLAIASLSRYPSYRDYQASTPRLIPFTRIGCIGQDS